MTSYETHKQSLVQRVAKLVCWGGEEDRTEARLHRLKSQNDHLRAVESEKMDLTFPRLSALM